MVRGGGGVQLFAHARTDELKGSQASAGPQGARGEELTVSLSVRLSMATRDQQAVGLACTDDNGKSYIFDLCITEPSCQVNLAHSGRGQRGQAGYSVCFRLARPHAPGLGQAFSRDLHYQPT